eukprot:149579-Chlamydomonas_euryale.AAC.1
MRPKRSKLGPKAEDAMPKLDRKVGAKGASDKTREAMLLKRSSCKRAWTLSPVIPTGNDNPTLSTLEARTRPHVERSHHRIG